MTRTLLLRLAAVRQSWGQVGTERTRTTAKVPTLTGVSGLVNAALGVPRGGRSALLDALTFHVRVDRPGTVESDFHTVSAPPPDVALIRQQGRRLRSYDASKGRADFVVPLGNGMPWVVDGRVLSHVSERHYLADAEFFLAVNGPDGDIRALSEAFHRPVFSPYLGRQAFAPQFPFHLGIRGGDGRRALSVLASTAAPGPLRVYQLHPHHAVQVARIDPPRTNMPLTAWTVEEEGAR